MPLEIAGNGVNLPFASSLASSLASSTASTSGASTAPSSVSISSASLRSTKGFTSIASTATMASTNAAAPPSLDELLQRQRAAVPTSAPSLTPGSAQQQQQQNNTGGGLFGNMSNTNTQNPPAGASLFGGSTTGNTLFGATGGLGSTQQNLSNNLFAKPQAPAAGSAGSMFASTAQRGQPAPSLLGTVQHNAANQQPFLGRLSMGQSAATNNTVSATNVNYDTLRPTTRFEDCIDQVKQDLEKLDELIQQQEKHAKDVEAVLPKHEESVNSISPDIELVKGKAEDVEQALISDAYGVEAQRKNTEKDHKDLERLGRIVHNQQLPQAYHYSGNMSLTGGFGSMYGNQQRPQQAPTTNENDDLSYDTDLVGNFFTPLAADLQKMMNGYAGNLSEIESHLKVIEQSAVMQAQTLAHRKAGMNGSQQASTEGTVRELADTLRGFEESILGVASVVGECREGVNELVLGRLGSTLGTHRY